MKTKSLIVILTLVIQFTGYSQESKANQTATTPPTTSSSTSQRWLKVEVSSVKLANRVQAYIGDGDDIYEFSPNGGMMTLFSLKGEDGKLYDYAAGEAHSSPNEMLLIVNCHFKNASTDTKKFNPLQVELGENTGTLLAAGFGSSYPFAKDDATWGKLKKRVELKGGGDFRGGDSAGPMTYVFRVSKTASIWKLMFQGIQIAELKPDR